MTRLGPLLLLLTLLSRCGGAALISPAPHAALHARTGPPRHFSLRRGEVRTFPPGVLLPGDVVTCELGGQPLRIRIPNRPNAGWAVGIGAATPAGSTRELKVTAASDGSVTASCGHGNS